MPARMTTSRARDIADALVRLANKADEQELKKNANRRKGIFEEATEEKYETLPVSEDTDGAARSAKVQDLAVTAAIADLQERKAY